MEKLPRTAESLAKQSKNVDVNKIVAIKINGVVKDLDAPISDENEVEYIMEGDKAALEILRHSAAHLMAHAIKRLYKNAKLAIGPAIEKGFYYDIDLDTQLSDGDLLVIEKEMKRISSNNFKIIRKEMQKDEAIRLFEELVAEQNSPDMNIANSNSEPETPF